MSEGVKNPIRGMFDAQSDKEKAEGDFRNEVVDITEKIVAEKNATEKMFETNPKKDDSCTVDDVKESIGKPPTTVSPPFKKTFRDSKLTAEERLLRVIDDNGDDMEGGRFKHFKLPKLGNITGKAGDVIHRLKDGWSDRRFSFATINRGLLIAVGLIVAVSVVNVLVFRPDIKAVHDRVVKIESRALGSTLIPYKRLEEYLAHVDKRSLFHLVKSDKVPTASPAAVPEGGNKMLEGLQLVGIAWGEYPEAMIRDKGEGRTYFLKKDQQFKGIKILEVSKDRVVVEYGGKTKELM